MNFTQICLRIAVFKSYLNKIPIFSTAPTNIFTYCRKFPLELNSLLVRFRHGTQHFFSQLKTISHFAIAIKMIKISVKSPPFQLNCCFSTISIHIDTILLIKHRKTSTRRVSIAHDQRWSEK